jgi:hypothetical protein
MGLSERQTRAYTDVVDLYEPILSTTNSLTGFSYAATPTYSGVKCRIQPRPELAIPIIMGKTGNDQIDTTDIIHVPVDQVIGTAYYVQLKTLGHPERLSWWVVQGEPRTQNWRAGKRACYLKRALKPTGVA